MVFTFLLVSTLLILLRKRVLFWLLRFGHRNYHRIILLGFEARKRMIYNCAGSHFSTLYNKYEYPHSRGKLNQ